MSELDPYRGNLKEHKVNPTLSDSVYQKLCEARRYPGQMITHAWDAQMQQWIDMATRLEVEHARLLQENEALRKELLTPEVFTRVVNWLKDPARKPAAESFTAGMERQICYALELDVLPHVKATETALRNMEALHGVVAHLSRYVRHKEHCGAPFDTCSCGLGKEFPILEQ